MNSLRLESIVIDTDAFGDCDTVRAVVVRKAGHTWAYSAHGNWHFPGSFEVLNELTLRNMAQAEKMASNGK